MRKIVDYNLDKNIRPFTNFAGAGVARRVENIEQYVKNSSVKLCMYTAESLNDIHECIAAERDHYMRNAEISGRKFKKSFTKHLSATYLIIVNLS